MKLRSNLFKSPPTFKEAQKAFTTNTSLLHGNFTAQGRFKPFMVDGRPESFGTQIAKPSFVVSILRESVVSRSLLVGKTAHACILKAGFVSDLVITNSLIHAYCSCASIVDAVKLFYENPERDVVSWNTMISGFSAVGSFEEGFSFYSEMKRVGIRPTQSSFASVMVALTGMGSFESCRQIHGEILKCGFSSDVLVGNALLTAYVRDGNIGDSEKMFDGMCNFNEVSCEILLGGYVQKGDVHDAFELFRYSCTSSVTLSNYAVSGLISLCSTREYADLGIQIHGYVMKIGFESDVSVMNSLISMYSRSFHLDDAIFLFDEANSRDIVTWNSIICGYGVNGEGDAGIGLVSRFLCAGLSMNRSTFSSFLSCCANVTILESAKRNHVLILKLRETFDQDTDNVILTMYCRSRSLIYASKVFKVMNERDVVAFNLMNGLFRSFCCYEDSIWLFHLNQLEGFTVDEFLYSNTFSSCSRLLNLDMGEQIHSCIVKTGHLMVGVIQNSLLEMYFQCGRFSDMEKLFCEIEKPDIFAWNIMVMGYASFGYLDQSIRVWKELKDSGLDLNEFSYSAMIDISSCTEVPVIGEQIQARIKKLGLDSDLVLMNSLLTMYSSCGIMEKASAIFEEIPLADSISWNAMVSGFAQNGFVKDAVQFYMTMICHGLKPNYMTYASILKSCTASFDHVLGSQFHAQVVNRGYDSYLTVSNSFISMYAKCGNIHDSLKIFQSTKSCRDVITWNSMISAYAHHGFGREALDMFSEMKLSGQKPNGITFVGVLSACSHAGLLSEAWTQFGSMIDHGVVPTQEHYTCMVDVLCRTGSLREANDFIDKMPFQPCSLIWRTLLSACSVNNNIVLGELAARKLMELSPNDPSSYVLLSNAYATAEKMEEKSDIRRRMEDKCLTKEIGNSMVWI